jgi:hypothetical protein
LPSCWRSPVDAILRIVTAVDARDALAELTQRSSEIVRVVIADPAGEPLAATQGAQDGSLARLGAELLRTGALVRPASEVERVEVALATGSVFALRVGGLTAVATTAPEPASALVVHDLRRCLEQVDAPATTPTGAGDA